MMRILSADFSTGSLAEADPQLDVLGGVELGSCPTAALCMRSNLRLVSRRIGGAQWGMLCDAHFPRKPGSGLRECALYATPIQ